MNPKHLLILILLSLLLITPAAAISINAPAQITSGQTITIWGFANSPQVTIQITGAAIHPLGSAINSTSVQNDYPTSTTVNTTIFGYWSYSAYLSGLEPLEYTITAYETTQTPANPGPISLQNYTRTVQQLTEIYTQLRTMPAASAKITIQYP